MSKGGHLAVQYALQAQLGRIRQVVSTFGLLRRTRNEADYPQADTPAITKTDVDEDLARARAIVEAMKVFLPQVGPFCAPTCWSARNPNGDEPETSRLGRRSHGARSQHVTHQ